MKPETLRRTLHEVPGSVLILILLGFATLLPALIGGVHMLPHGWVYRREEPGKFWFICAAQAVGISLFLGVLAFGLSR